MVLKLEVDNTLSAGSRESRAAVKVRDTVLLPPSDQLVNHLTPSEVGAVGKLPPMEVQLTSGGLPFDELNLEEMPIQGELAEAAGHDWESPFPASVSAEASVPVPFLAR
jgi:hypothetical protein